MIVTADTLQSIPVKVRHRVPIEHEVDVSTATLPCTVSGRVVMRPSPVVKQPELKRLDHDIQSL